MNETQLTAVGNVVTAIQMRTLADGTTKAYFRIACNERWFNRADGTWQERDSVYMSVNCWRGLAEHVGASLKVGDPVIVRGRLLTRQYDKDGRQATAVEIEASAVGPDLTWSTAEVTRVRKATAVPEQGVALRPAEPVEAGVGG
ncbi:single-stranded DNA-binding protein [Pseudonocardia sp. GCM10023141]|uniref:single-stranded DNA-binding protein n=1 Tax=Pseudonocardia sp. GCM10023141 TaxID=3252653 RepID=UPI003612786D